MLQENLRVTLLQSDLVWEDKDRNLSEFSRKIDAVSEPTDVVVLPEMFNTGFSMNTKLLSEKMDGKTISWMKQKASKKSVAICGSLIVEEGGKYFNRFVWAFPDGNIEIYDKRHLFRMAGENEYFTSGSERKIILYKDWRICPMVCYDLRFPVWSRNINRENRSNEPIYDLLIYVANWPEARRYPWQILLKARAIENQCYVLGVNRVGKDGKQISYSGDSVVINPKGEELTGLSEYSEETTTVSLNAPELNEFREKFKVWMDGDEFKIV